MAIPLRRAREASLLGPHSAMQICYNRGGANMVPPTLDISEARKQLNSLDQRLKDDRVIVVTRQGKKAFAAVDLEYLETVLETLEVLSDPDAMGMLQQSIADVRAGRVYSHEEIERELG